MFRFVHFFDRLEDKTRAHLSHAPMLYAIIGGFFVVVFWRGVWHTADILERSGGLLSTLFSGPVSVIVSAAILMMTGLFVSFFIGDRILLSGLKHEKKVAEKTEAEVKQESTILFDLAMRMDRLEKEIHELKNELKK